MLTAAGYAPRFLERPACCGLTWISTSQLDGARRQLRSALDVLHPVVAAGTPVVGLEPSCTAVSATPRSCYQVTSGWPPSGAAC